METRQVTEYKIYLLALNTFGPAEEVVPVAQSSDLQRLQEFYMDNLLPYEDRFRDDFGFLHSFKEGPLFNFNPCSSLEVGDVGLFGDGIHELWVSENNMYKAMSNYLWVD